MVHIGLMIIALSSIHLYSSDSEKPIDDAQITVSNKKNKTNRTQLDIAPNTFKENRKKKGKSANPSYKPSDADDDTAIMDFLQNMMPGINATKFNTPMRLKFHNTITRIMGVINKNKSYIPMNTGLASIICKIHATDVNTIVADEGILSKANSIYAEIEPSNIFTNMKGFRLVESTDSDYLFPHAKTAISTLRSVSVELAIHNTLYKRHQALTMPANRLILPSSADTKDIKALLEANKNNTELDSNTITAALLVEAYCTADA